MSPPPTAPRAALHWERLTPDHGLGAPVRPPAFAAILGARMFVALTDARNQALLFAAGSDGVPVAVGPVPMSATGLCAKADHLVLTGVRARDSKPIALEIDAGGKIIHEVELPTAGTLHRQPQPVCTHAGIRVVWEEPGPSNASTLVWADLSGAVLGPVRRHAWPDRTVGFAPAADGAGVMLLRDSGHPPHAQLYHLGDAGPDQGVPLSTPAVATPVTSADETAVLLVPAPQTLQLGIVDTARRIAPAPLTVLGVPPPSVIDGALLIEAERGVWAIAVASGGPDSSAETLAGEPVRREDYALVACDARARTAGPPQAIEPPLAARWLDGQLVLWTGRAGAAVSTWRLVP